MGAENKLLLPWRGKRILETVVETLVAASLLEVVVVVGHQREQVETALRGYPVRSVVNERFDEGMASSLRRGIETSANFVSGYLVALGDMPEIDETTVTSLCERLIKAGPETIVLPVKDGQRGHPVLFGKGCRDELLMLSGDCGARAVIDAHPKWVVEVVADSAGIFTDVDTPQAYRNLRPSRS